MQSILLLVYNYVLTKSMVRRMQTKVNVQLSTPANKTWKRKPVKALRHRILKNLTVNLSLSLGIKKDMDSSH